MADINRLGATLDVKNDPASVANAIRDIKRQLGSTDIPINVKFSPRSQKDLKEVQALLSSVDSKKVTLNINSNANVAANNLQKLAEATELAIKRFGAFVVGAGAILKTMQAISAGTRNVVEFQNEIVRLSQIAKSSSANIAQGIGSEVTKLSTSLGVASKDLLTVSSTLLQAGLSAKDTKIALEALAKTALAPSFENLQQTTEGAIAAIQQFGIEAKDLENVLGSINSVAAAFAVESRDLITLIQKTGGAFKAVSGDLNPPKEQLNQLLALFTSVRGTTRESADAIATGFRTIFARLERPKTVEALRDLGISLTDTEGKFVGAFKAVELLSGALSKLDDRDIRKAAIIEEIGGIRQISRVIPLLNKFPTTLRAYQVAQAGANSLTEDADRAQESFSRQLTIIEEKFYQLFRTIGDSGPLQTTVKAVGIIVNKFLDLLNAGKAFVPILTAISGLVTIIAGTKFLGFIGQKAGIDLGAIKNGISASAPSFSGIRETINNPLQTLRKNRESRVQNQLNNDALFQGVIRNQAKLFLEKTQIGANLGTFDIDNSGDKGLIRARDAISRGIEREDKLERRRQFLQSQIQAGVNTPQNQNKLQKINADILKTQTKIAENQAKVANVVVPNVQDNKTFQGIQRKIANIQAASTLVNNQGAIGGKVNLRNFGVDTSFLRPFDPEAVQAKSTRGKSSVNKSLQFFLNEALDELAKFNEVTVEKGVQAKLVPTSDVPRRVPGQTFGATQPQISTLDALIQSTRQRTKRKPSDVIADFLKRGTSSQLGKDIGGLSPQDQQTVTKLLDELKSTGGISVKDKSKVTSQFNDLLKLQQGKTPVVDEVRTRIPKQALDVLDTVIQQIVDTTGMSVKKIREDFQQRGDESVLKKSLSSGLLLDLRSSKVFGTADLSTKTIISEALSKAQKEELDFVTQFNQTAGKKARDRLAKYQQAIKDGQDRITYLQNQRAQIGKPTQSQLFRANELDSEIAKQDAINQKLGANFTNLLQSGIKNKQNKDIERLGEITKQEDTNRQILKDRERAIRNQARREQFGAINAGLFGGAFTLAGAFGATGAAFGDNSKIGAGFTGAAAGTANGALVGGVLGQAIGAINPAIGTAVTLFGVLAGAITGTIDGLNNFTKQINERSVIESTSVFRGELGLFQENKISGSRVSGAGRFALDDVAKGFAELDKQANQFSFAKLFEQIKGGDIAEFIGKTTAKDKTNLISNLVPEFTQLREIVLNSSSSLAEFRNNISGNGRIVIEGLALATQQNEALKGNIISLEKAKQIEELKIIESIKLNNATRELTNANLKAKEVLRDTLSDFIKLQEAFSAFQIDSEFIQSSVNSVIDAISSKISSPSVNLVDTLQQSPSIFNQKSFENAIKTFSNVGIPKDIIQVIRDSRTVESNIRGIIDDLIAQGPQVQLQDSFNKLVDERIGKTDPALVNAIKNSFRASFGATEQPQAAARQLRLDRNKFIDTLSTEVVGPFKEQITSIASTIQSTNQKLIAIEQEKIDALQRVNEAEIQLSQARLQSVQAAADASSNFTGLNAGRFTSLQQLDSVFNKRLEVTGFSRQSPEQIGKTLTDLLQKLEQANARNATGLPNEETTDLVRRIGNANKALELLSNTTERLAGIQRKIADEQANQQSRRTLGLQLLGGSNKERVDLNVAAAAATAVIQQFQKGRSIDVLPERVRQQGVQLLGNQFKDIKIGQAGGLTGEEILNQILLGQGAGGIGPNLLGGARDKSTDRIQELFEQQAKILTEAEAAAAERVKIQVTLLDSVALKFDKTVVLFGKHVEAFNQVRQQADLKRQGNELAGPLNIPNAANIFANPQALNAFINQNKVALNDLSKTRQVLDSELKKLNKNFSVDKTTGGDVGKLFEQADFLTEIGREQLNKLIPQPEFVKIEQDVVKILKERIEEEKKLGANRRNDVAEAFGADLAPLVRLITPLLPEKPTVTQNALKGLQTGAFDPASAKLVNQLFQAQAIERIGGKFNKDILGVQGAQAELQKKAPAGVNVIDVINNVDAITNALSVFRKEGILNFQNITKDAADISAQLKNINNQLGGLFGAPAAEGKAGGGSIFKKRGTDTVPTMLTPGEFIVNKRSTDKNRTLLEKINRGEKVDYKAKGGFTLRGAKQIGIAPDLLDKEQKKLLEDVKNRAFLAALNKEETGRPIEQDINRKAPQFQRQIAVNADLQAKRAGRLPRGVVAGSQFDSRQFRKNAAVQAARASQELLGFDDKQRRFELRRNLLENQGFQVDEKALEKDIFGDGGRKRLVDLQQRLPNLQQAARTNNFRDLANIKKKDEEMVKAQAAGNLPAVDKAKQAIVDAQRAGQGAGAAAPAQQAQGVGALNPDIINKMVVANTALAQSMDKFNVNSVELTKALNDFPRQIKLEGNRQVEVIIKGGDALKAINNDALAAEVAAIKAKLDELIPGGL